MTQVTREAVVTALHELESAASRCGANRTMETALRLDIARLEAAALLQSLWERCEAAERALQEGADKITQSLSDELAAAKRLLDAARESARGGG